MEFVIGAVLVIGALLGALFGWIACFQLIEVKQQLSQLEIKVKSLRRRLSLSQADLPDLEDESEWPVEQEPQSPVDTILPDALPAEPLDEGIEEMDPEIADVASVVGSVDEEPATVEPISIRGESPVSTTDILKVRLARHAEASTAVTETKVGGTYLAWAGAFMSILGVCFFLKLLYDRGLIGPTGRITIAYIFGTVAILCSRLKAISRYPSYATTILGLGFAIYYCAAFFSYGVYHLWGSGLAFSMTTLTTVAAFTTAYRRDTQVLGALALLGAFASLIVFETYRTDTSFLFVNIAILDLVVCYLTFKKSWNALILEALWGTIFIGFSWHSHQNFYLALIPSIAAVSAFGLIFSVFPVLKLKSKTDDFDFGDNAITIISTLTVIFAMTSLLYKGHPLWLVETLALHAVILSILTWIAGKKTHWQSDACYSLTCQTAAVLIALCIAARSWADWNILAIPMCLSLVVLSITNLSVLCKHDRLNHAAAIVLGFVGTWLFVGGIDSFEFDALELARANVYSLFNVRFGLWLGTALVLLASAVPIWKTKSHSFAQCLGAMGIFTFIAACNFELSFYYESIIHLERQAGLSKWAAFALLWGTFCWSGGTLERQSKLNGTGQTSAVIATGGFAVLGLSLLAPRESAPWLMLNLEFAARLYAAIGIGICCWQFRKQKPGEVWQILECITHIAVAALLSWEFPDEIRFGSAVPEGRTGILSIAWSIQAIGLIAFGLRTRNVMRRKLGLTLFAVVIAKILLSDTIHLDAIGRILSFVGTGLFLLLGSYLYNRFEGHVAEQASP